jgi:type II secretory ATPase GspE/PulE/Tfp pilus assembly ATPase PilB-like protein
LHANDATGAVTAMRNFHIAPHLLASSFRGVVAQRLLRKICDRCKVHEPLGHAAALALGLDKLPEGLVAYRGAGCPACLHTGYSGRTGVFEIFRVDETARNMILEEASERDIRAYAISQGMRSLQQDGIQKIADGITTVEEFHRVLRF